jgi:glycosyltransferase involved in cell wall biosynthesis
VRLLYDLQGAQSVDHRDRGVARYVRELALAYERRDGGDGGSPVVRYLLNPDLPLPGGIEPLVASGKLTFVDEPGAYDGADVLHLASPVELSIPIDRLLPAAVRERRVPLQVVATVFDLIPLAMAETYLEDPGQRRRYRSRLELLRGADGLVAISEHVARDVVERLGVPSSRVTAVPLVASPSFSPDPTVARERVVLAPGGSDGRKNLEGLVRAWAMVRDGARRGWRLVVVGALPPLFANHLLVLAGGLGVRESVELAGFVTEDELVAWNRRASLVVYPSLAEGFGLPVVEAHACGTPAIAGDNTSLVELLPDEARFDATSVPAMAAAIERALTDPPTVPARPTRTWDDVATATAAFCARLSTRAVDRRAQNGSGRRRVAFVAPMPPQPGGVADHSARLVSALRERDDVELDVFVDGPPHQREAILAADGRPLAALHRVEAVAGTYDEIVVALGNSEFHTGGLALLAKRPGTATVVAHDVRLTTLYRFAPWQHPEAAPGGFAATLHRMYDGRLPADLGAAGELSPDDAERWGVLMARDAIAASRRFLTTSAFAAELARLDARPADRSKIGVLPFALGGEEPVAPAPDRDPLVVSFGVLNRLKQAPLLVEAFAAAAATEPTMTKGARLAFVGPAGAGDTDAVLAAARAAGITERVEVVGAVDDATYRTWLARAWVAVQLRAATNGESSAAIGDTLAAGVPTVVTAIGANRGLPAEAVVAVPSDVTAERLAHELRSLLTDEARRRAMATAARGHAATATFAAAADALLSALS